MAAALCRESEAILRQYLVIGLANHLKSFQGELRVSEGAQ
jgi:hypothetical protein